MAIIIEPNDEGGGGSGGGGTPIPVVDSGTSNYGKIIYVGVAVVFALVAYMAFFK